MIKSQMDEIKRVIINLNEFSEFIAAPDDDSEYNIEDHIHFYKIDRENIIYPFILIDYGDTTLSRISNNKIPFTSNSYFILIEDIQESYNNYFEDFTDEVVNLINEFFINCHDLHLLSIDLVEGPVESKYKNNNVVSMIFKLDIGF